MRINKSFDSLVGILQANKCETPQIIICKRREEFSNFRREILIRKFVNTKILQILPSKKEEIYKLIFLKKKYTKFFSSSQKIKVILPFLIYNNRVSSSISKSIHKFFLSPKKKNKSLPTLDKFLLSKD